jgi:hypothetical protein
MVKSHQIQWWLFEMPGGAGALPQTIHYPSIYWRPQSCNFGGAIYV